MYGKNNRNVLIAIKSANQDKQKVEWVKRHFRKIWCYNKTNWILTIIGEKDVIHKKNE